MGLCWFTFVLCDCWNFTFNMRILILILFFICCSSQQHLPIITGRYFVAPGGDDNNTGAIDKPFKTWQKAFNIAQAGDIVYIRGGVYYEDPNITITNNGTKDKPICFFNYPT